MSFSTKRHNSQSTLLLRMLQVLERVSLAFRTRCHIGVQVLSDLKSQCCKFYIVIKSLNFFVIYSQWHWMLALICTKLFLVCVHSCCRCSLHLSGIIHIKIVKEVGQGIE
jgi:hypothetical protein